jgi:hypothetical protein
VLGGEICPKFEDENLSEKLSAEMRFCKIDPWTTMAPMTTMFKTSGHKNMAPDSRETVAFVALNPFQIASILNSKQSVDLREVYGRLNNK